MILKYLKYCKNIKNSLLKRAKGRCVALWCYSETLRNISVLSTPPYYPPPEVLSGHFRTEITNIPIFQEKE